MIIALGGSTRTVTRLMSRSPTVRDSFYSDPLHQALVEHFLALETTHWYGPSPLTTTSHPLLSIAITFDILPGTPPQGLHRDDKNHHWRHQKRDQYKRGQDVLLGLFVPGIDTCRANGATRIVPGSHLWGDEKPDIKPEDVLDAEMKVGEAFIMLGGLYHGGGHYEKPLTDQEGESRTVFAMFSCNGVSRQEEIPWLAYTVDEVERWSDVMKQRIGWKWSEPNLGWVDLVSPDKYFAKLASS